jgi:hypothetical protein
VLDQRHQFLAGFVEFGFQRHRLCDDGGDFGCFVGHVRGLVAVGGQGMATMED